jgi:ribosomal protein L19E
MNKTREEIQQLIQEGKISAAMARMIFGSTGSEDQESQAAERARRDTERRFKESFKSSTNFEYKSQLRPIIN